MNKKYTQGASTRNRNSRGDYFLETVENRYGLNYNLYPHNSYGVPYQSHFAGDGLLQQRMSKYSLSNHSVDLESFLFGINSTNLMAPREQFVPHIKTLDSLDIYKKAPLVMPQKIVFDKNQRPYLYEN